MTEKFYNWKFVDTYHVIVLLEQLKELYSDPSKWIASPMAINSQLKPVEINSPEAVAWSSLGACDKIANEHYPSIANYVSCAAREFLDDLSDNRLFKRKLSYKEEYDLICNGLNFLIEL